MKKTGFVGSLEYKKHQTGLGHPESTRRIDAVLNAIEAAKLDLQKIEPRLATKEDLQLCHTADYIAIAERDVASGSRQLSTGDTTISKDSYQTALLASGGILAAVDAVNAGTVKNAFCALRPPGHHACPAKGMGFCLFNNIAIAVRYAQKKHGIGKVLIADWDVHHGNGTQDIFYADGSVHFLSIHRYGGGFYPGTGAANETVTGRGLGKIRNVPVRFGTSRKDYLERLRQSVGELADHCKPE